MYASDDRHEGFEVESEGVADDGDRDREYHSEDDDEDDGR